MFGKYVYPAPVYHLACYRFIAVFHLTNPVSLDIISFIMLYKNACHRTKSFLYDPNIYMFFMIAYVIMAYVFNIAAYCASPYML